MLFPVGIEDHHVNRLPWVSIGLAALCLLAFVATWLVPGDPQERLEQPIAAVGSYLQRHPWLVVPERFERRFFREKAASIRAALDAEAAELSRPDEGTIAAQQVELERLLEEAAAALDDHPLHRWALVPARGVAQPGWLTHLFLHAGWLHLLGNLFFFYLVGPLLEDAWGRPVFGAFYVVGGIFAAVVYALPSLQSEVFLVGASGAVAACIGAFSLRFAAKNVRMFYFYWVGRIFTGTFLMPAWGWGLLWFAGEVYSLVTVGSGSGVAFLAHVGGFLFGLAIAGLFRWQQVEERWLAGAVEATHTWKEPAGVAAGLAAIERGEVETARRELRAALQEDPACGARLPLVKLELAAGPTDAAVAQATDLFGRLLARNDDGAVTHAVEELGEALPAERLRPQLAYRLAQIVDRGPPGLWRTAARLYRASVPIGGAIAEKALFRAAELRLHAGGEPEQALAVMAEAGALGGALPDRWHHLERQARSQLQQRPVIGTPSGLELATEGESRPRMAGLELGPDFDALATPPPSVRLVKLVGRDEAGLQLAAPREAAATVAWGDVQALAVGRIEQIPTSRGALSDVRVVDLVLDWGGSGRGASVLRLPDRGLPEASEGDAFVQLCRELHERSGATVLPEAGALAAAELPSFPTLQALEEACYGAAAGPAA